MIYKKVIGYEDTYLVSEYGDVKRINTNKVLKSNPVKGYLKIELCKDSIRKSFSVHRLVAMAFIENPLKKEQVNHIDGNKLNNHFSNLEWSTPKENTIHAIKNGLRKSSINQRRAASRHMTNYNNKETLDLRTGIVFDSLKIACESTNFNYLTAISQMYRKSSNSRFKYI